MEINKELLQKLLPAKTVDEVIKLAKDNGFELLKDQAEKIFEQIKDMDELDDKAVDGIMGAIGDKFGDNAEEMAKSAFANLKKLF
ncbi:MAG: DUF2624 family protein [Oscillospiraceae bacterium]|nr:DUF2624 family protein [Oscillospiraceae bacterium]